ncbi:MAG: DUF928 domain-containing protein [Scytonema sp. RU_4_4]|nr:DUF928 domain-containing protein [Scytonema sp. RU_4_4]
MTRTKLPVHNKKPFFPFFTITLTLLGFISYPMSVLAQSHMPESNNPNITPILSQQQQNDGSSQGRPGKRKGTGSRGNCHAVKIPLTALVSSNDLSLSVEENPTFWFFVPYKSDAISSGEFSLQDEANNDVYRTSFTLPFGAGIVSFNLPSTISLEINKKYQWYFKLYCKNANRQASTKGADFVYGLVQRVTLKPEIEHQLKAATAPRSRIAIYAQNRIWQSALTELAKLRLADPQNTNLYKDWDNLLRDMGLENLAEEPILGEVKSKN